MSESDYTQVKSNAISSLSSSVAALRASLSLLDSSISILASGTADFPRLQTILASTRHFELTPSSTLTAAQKSLAAEIQPVISTLLSRAEAYIERLERKQQGLKARNELLEGRLEGSRISNTKNQGNRNPAKKQLDNPDKSSLPNVDSHDNATRLMALRQKKERLGYTIERLVLQSQQRQRQLRMSVAAS